MKEIIRIIRFSSSLWKYYLIVSICVIAISLLNLVQPFLIKGIIDLLVAKGAGQNVQLEQLLIRVGIILIAVILVTLISNLNGYVGDMLAVRLNSLLSQRYFDHLLRLPIEYYDNEMTGKITARLERSISTISQMVQTLANNFVQFFLTTIVTLIVISIYSWQVAVLLVIIFPAYIYITQLSSKSWQKQQESINKNLDVANGRFVESVTQIRVVKSFINELVESAFYRRQRRIIERKTKVQSRKWHKYDIWRRLVLGLVFAGIFAFIAAQAFWGVYTIGTAVLLITLAEQAQWPLFGSSFVIDGIQRARAGSIDYFKVMETEPKIADQPNAKKLNIRDGAIEIKDANFSYSKGKPVLSDVSFDITPHSKVALVGESGEGKTTIANLLVRFYELGSGSIKIDGVDISKVTQRSLRQQVGIVFQDPALFSGTIEENISYGLRGYSQADLIRAAKAANAYDFIQKLPDGFATEVGERGIKLSGGQKQRIVIARAILKNPPILILDEATSSLDARAEREVQQALEHLMKDRTTIIIAHRLSTIAGVDMVVGLNGGKVAEIGPPAVLAKRRGGIYAELLQLQQAPQTKSTKAKLKQYELA